MSIYKQDKVRDIINALKLSEKDNLITMINGVH